MERSDVFVPMRFHNDLIENSIGYKLKELTENIFSVIHLPGLTNRMLNTISNQHVGKVIVSLLITGYYNVTSIFFSGHCCNFILNYVVLRQTHLNI